MDSKKKFQKNRYWKSKYQPRNPNSVKHVVKSKSVKVEQELSSESENDESNTLKQPIPSKGWFFEDEDELSLSSEENQELVISNKPSIYEEPVIDANKSELTEAEEKLLLSLDYRSGKKNIIVYENKLEEKVVKQEPERQSEDQTCSSKLNLEKDFENLVLGLKTRVPSNPRIEKTKIESKCDDEKELDFLLSLEEPIRSGPTNLKKHIENERKLKSSNSLKFGNSNDLEKFLDSVLDA